MNHNEIAQLKTIIKEEFQALKENTIQQQSGHHSDLLKQVQVLEEKFDNRMDTFDTKITSLERELSSWKLGSKIGVAVIVAIGGFITWVINTLGVKIGIIR